MTSEDPEREFDLLKEIQQAKDIFYECKEKVLETLRDEKSQRKGKELAKEVNFSSNEFLKSLNILAAQEAKLGKQSDSIRGVLQGGALDLDGARAEVLERIARFRQRN